MRAILGLPIPAITSRGPGASAVILADRAAGNFRFERLADALATDANVDVRIFAKPVTRPGRRMGVALARAGSVEEARRLATSAAGRVRIVYS
jgi:phosphoribosylglycinamide formyltransferase 2